MKQLSTLFLILLSTCFLQLDAQISFTNSNNRLQNADFHSGVAIGVADMNNDGLDDIVRLANSRVLNIELQQAGSQQFQNIELEQVSGSSQWSLCIADVNNDGYNEVICGGAYDGVKMIKAINNGTSYEMSELPGPGLFVQGSNLVDINNDGYLDYFACHDDAESRIWRNDSTGNFIQADEWIDMTTNPASDNSGNYGSIWTDFDNDGDIDLYIAKCRQGVNNPSDPRRINALYVNDGSGNFTEQSEAAGLKIGAQSWTADFQDIDNDGDFDCFITNHDLPSMLLENDGTGVFSDISAESGIDVGGLPIQGVMRDFDNDGFVDIIVAGSEHALFKNNGDKTFTRVEEIFDDNDMESYAIGDLNHDGFLDVYGGYAEIYTSPTGIDDVVWLNDGKSGNNFFDVHLVGVESNRNGIGARIEIYGEWGIQIREVRSGESYGIMNSMTQHFGIGTASSIDSMIIRWPSGQLDHYEDLVGNQFVTIIEGDCMSPESTVVVDGETTFCDGDSIQLTAAAGLNYLWNTGETTQSIWVSEQGGYTVSVNVGEACSSNSPMVEVVLNPDETPTITVEGELVFCVGGSVMLNSSPAASYNWSNGADTDFIIATESGEYTITTEGLCESFTSEPVLVEVLPSEAPEVIEDVLGPQDSITVTVSGNNVYWYEDENSMDAFAIGNTVALPVINSQAVAYAENHELYIGESYATGMLAHEGGEYSGNQYNGAVVFDCYNPFILQQVTVYTDTEGPRVIELRDADGLVLESKEVYINEGIDTIELDFMVEPALGLHLITNGTFNLDTYGFFGPRLQRSNENVTYPYVVEDVARLYDSNFGSERYYYFFDWKIQEPSYECISERTAVALLFVDTEENELTEQSLKLSPNPATESIRLQLPLKNPANYRLRLLNAQGQLIVQQELKHLSVDYELQISHLATGLYYVQLINDGNSYIGSLIKN